MNEWDVGANEDDIFGVNVRGDRVIEGVEIDDSDVDIEK